MATALPEGARNLLRMLEEDADTPEDQLGCMKGILQFFDRYPAFPSRRYGLTKPAIAANGQSTTPVPCQLRVTCNACGLPAYDKSCANKDIGARSAHPFQSSTDSSNEIGTSRASNWLNDASYGASEYVPKNSRRHLQPETCTSSALQRRVCLDARDSSMSATKISNLCTRDILQTSLHREESTLTLDTVTKEVTSGLSINLENLPQLASVDLELGDLRQDLKFPVMSSNAAGTSSQPLHTEGHGALRTTYSPEFQLQETNVIARSLPNSRRFFGGEKIAPRLTVELEESPKLGSHKTMNPRRQCNASIYEKYEPTHKRCYLRNLFRAGKAKDSMRTSQSKKEAVEFAEDGISDSPHTAIPSRLSTAGRNASQLEQPIIQIDRHWGSNCIDRLLGAEECPHPYPEQSIYDETGDCKFPMVEANVLQGVVLSSPGCLPSGEWDRLIRMSEKWTSRQERLENRENGENRIRYRSPEHRSVDFRSPLFRNQEAREALACRVAESQKKSSATEPLLPSFEMFPTTQCPLHEDLKQQLEQFQLENMAHEKESLKHILDVESLSGLLHHHRRIATLKTPSSLVTQSYSSDLNPELQYLKGKRNAPPIIVVQDIEEGYAGAPAHEGISFASIDRKIEQSAPGQDNVKEQDPLVSIVVLKPAHTQPNGAPVSKRLEYIIKKCGFSEREVTKIACSRPRNQRTSPREKTLEGKGSRPTIRSSNSILVGNSKLRPYPRHEPPSPESQSLGTATIGRISVQELNTRSQEFTAPKIKAVSQSKGLKNQLNMEGRSERVRRPSMLDAKVKEKARVSRHDAGAAKISVEVVLLQNNRLGKGIDMNMRCVETEVPWNCRNRVTKMSSRSVTATMASRSLPGEDYQKLKTCSKVMNQRENTHGNSLQTSDAFQKHIEKMQIRKRKCQAQVKTSADVERSNYSNFSGSLLDCHALKIRNRLQSKQIQVLQSTKEVVANKEHAIAVVITKESLGRNGLLREPCGQPVKEVQKFSSVSVVDQRTFIQKEMCSMSFRTGNSAPINLQDTFEGSKCQNTVWETQKQHLQSDRSSSTPVVGGSPCEHGSNTCRQSSKLHPNLQLPYDTSAEIDQIESSLADQDKEGQDMHNVLILEGRKNKNAEDCKRLNNVDGSMPLRKCDESGGVEIMNRLLDRRLLNDSVNELVEQKPALYASAQPWVGLTPLQVKLKSVGQNLIDEIWEDLESITCSIPESVCDRVQNIIDKDFLSPSSKWDSIGTEVDEVVVELENMTYDDLLEEVVKELTLQFRPGKLCSQNNGVRPQWQHLYL